MEHHEQQPVVVWLATFSDHKRKDSFKATGRLHTHLSVQAECSPGIYSALCQHELNDELEMGAICQSVWPTGHELVGVTALLPLCSAMKAQYDFWSVLAQDVLENSLYYFRVLKAEKLSVNMSLQETRTGKNTCFFNLNPV